MKKYLFLLSLFAFIGACSQPQSRVVTSLSSSGVNGQGNNVEQLSQRFNQLQQGGSDAIRITQFGDSHSAADFFSNRLRKVLQKRYGDAGIGWVLPLSIKGQRHAKISHETQGWKLLDSRRNDYAGNYPMGGYVARSQSDRGFIRFNYRNNDGGRWLLSLLIKGNQTDDWQVASYTTRLPTEIASKRVGMEVGGIWLTREPATGVIVETVAANGAQNTWLDKWDDSWLSRDLARLSRSDMVILAYGTNEAFNNRLNIKRFERNIKRRIEQIRQALPNAVILVIGAPESYKKRPTRRQLANVSTASMNCKYQRPAMLTQVQQVQSDIAAQQGVLHWSWQQAMGGECQVPRLIKNGLMQKDGIHFTIKGYQHSADKLIGYLESIGLIN